MIAGHEKREQERDYAICEAQDISSASQLVQLRGDGPQKRQLLRVQRRGAGPVERHLVCGSDRICHICGGLSVVSQA
jgi:hypothetical protein